MKRLALVVVGSMSLASLSFAASAVAQAPTLNRDPALARLVTSDLPNFWRALDASAGADSAARVRSIEELYLRPGSPGLRAWVKVRLVDQEAVLAKLDPTVWPRSRIVAVMRAPGGGPDRPALEAAAAPYLEHDATEQLARTVGQVPDYYRAIRANALSLDTTRAVTDSIRAGFRRFATMYADAAFPDVYFLVGRLTSGGTSEPAGLLLGVEVNERGGRTPAGLPMRSTATPAERTTRYARIVWHELIHYQQHGRGGGTVLDASLGEGAADFVSGLIAGDAAPCAGGSRNAWGIAHEAQLWSEFRLAASSEKSGEWLYNGGRSGDRPADLGYFMGCRIVADYYRTSGDKAAALRRILARDDAAGLLRESGYGARFGGSGGT